MPSGRERGVLMDVTLRRNLVKRLSKLPKPIQAGWVGLQREAILQEGYPLYLYQTYILEDFIEGGKYRSQLDEATKERIDTAYKEMNEHVGLKW